MTENSTRTELFAALGELAEIVSDMRGGQVMAAVGELCADLHGRGLWDANDAELLEAVWQFRRNFEAAASHAGREWAEQAGAVLASMTRRLSSALGGFLRAKVSRL